MEQNIVIQIVEDKNPEEARFRKGDFLIGTEGTLALLKNHSSVLSSTFYTLKKATIDEVKESDDVKYHHVSRGTAFNFKFVTIHKEVALKHLNYKKKIPIKYHEKRKLHDVIDDKEQTHFLNEMAKYESECVLEGDWLNWTDCNEKLPQINYYNSLKSDRERQIYADSLSLQYALTLLLGPISNLTDTYDLECVNTFFKNVEFYFEDEENKTKNDETEYLTSLKIQELWLPVEHFETNNYTNTKEVNGVRLIKLDEYNVKNGVEQYSFTSNRIKFDTDWYDKFLIKLNDQYTTSLRIKELWLPAAHFNLDNNTKTKIVNGIEFVEIDDAIENYSFTNNRVRYDSHWYSDFLIKL